MKKITDIRQRTYLGKHLVVGITVRTSAGDVVKSFNRHGVVTKTDDKEIVLQIGGGKEYRLPPDLDAIETAAPGAYHLCDTGELVEDPELSMTLEITLSEESEAKREAVLSELMERGFPPAKGA